jgi:hypothetical protein
VRHGLGGNPEQRGVVYETSLGQLLFVALGENPEVSATGALRVEPTNVYICITQVGNGARERLADTPQPSDRRQVI